jgi:sterol desaturase/sphingolipid hydroxylase (fatty acid hydroxylase superfamily)
VSARDTSLSDSLPAKPGLQPPSSVHNFLRWMSWWPISFLVPIGLVFFQPKGGITIHGYTYSFENLSHSVGLGSLLGIKVVIAALLTELLSVGWAASSIRHMCTVRSASWWSDIGVAIMNNIHLSRIIAIVLSFGIALASFEWLHNLLARASGIQFGLNSLPEVPQFIISFFIIYTVLDYWDHRLVHMRVFWPLHRFHHAPTEFYVFTSTRVHPADITPSLIMVGPLVLLGIAPDVLLAVALFRIYLGSIQHSQIQSDWGWFGRWIIYPPAGHRLHHMLDESRPTCNFALIPIWDHLFGTWRGDYTQQIAIGVSTPYRHGAWFFADLWRDYCDFMRELRSFLHRLRPSWMAARE